MRGAVLSQLLTSQLPELKVGLSMSHESTSVFIGGARAGLKPTYDFIVCGAGSSGSVVARRLAEDPVANVLLLEAGGSDEVPAVVDATQHWTNQGTERDWGFQAEPNPLINGRRLQMSMGKVLGGGSGINPMIWARGHKADWDFFAAEAGNSAWGYESVLELYRQIENWHGAPDPCYRGTGGPVFVQPAPDPNPLVAASLEAAASVGIPTYENPNGRLMETDRGAAVTDVRFREGRRESVFRSYVYPYLDRPNLTLLTHAVVQRLTFDRTRVTGVEILHDGVTSRIAANLEVVMSLGAINTPRVLMQSGVGDGNHLRDWGIPVIQHLPGVGQNLQDHLGLQCVWEYPEPVQPRNNMTEGVFFWADTAGALGPEMFVCQGEIPISTAENTLRFGLPEIGWVLHGAVSHPKSRGRVSLTGNGAADPVRIDANSLSHPDDMRLAIACVGGMREIGNATALRPFVKREVMPGDLCRAELENFIRDGAVSYWHQVGTAKMGRDEMSVVDAELKVYGIEGLRVADGSIMPRLTTSNTMAPCVVIGERAAEFIQGTPMPRQGGHPGTSRSGPQSVETP
jgi:choline dehydrogenase